jgi:hypothetical protein
MNHSAVAAPRYLCLSLVLAIALLVVGCGGTLNPTPNQTANSLLSPASSEPTATTTAQTNTSVPPPAPKPVATWHFSWAVEGGYHYSGILSLGPPEHIQERDIAPCTADATTETQIIGEVTLRNETSGFPGEPILDFETQPPNESELERISFGGGAECLGDSEGGDNVEYSPGHKLSPGEYAHFDIALVVPNYYSPEYPGGNPARLNEYKFTTVAAVAGAGPVQVTGPALETFGPNTNPRFSLAAVGGK